MAMSKQRPTPFLSRKQLHRFAELVSVIEGIYALGAVNGGGDGGGGSALLGGPLGWLRPLALLLAFVRVRGGDVAWLRCVALRLSLSFAGWLEGCTKSSRCASSADRAFLVFAQVPLRAVRCRGL